MMGNKDILDLLSFAYICPECGEKMTLSFTELKKLKFCPSCNTWILRSDLIQNSASAIKMTNEKITAAAAG